MADKNQVSPDVEKNGNGRKTYKVNIGQILTTVGSVILLCLTVSAFTYSRTVDSIKESLVRIIDTNAQTIKDNAIKNAAQDILLQEFKTKLDYIIDAIRKLDG